MCKHNGKTMIKLCLCASKGKKWLTAALVTFGEFCSFAKRLFYENLHVFLILPALRPSVGLLGQFATVWKNRTGHTNTTNYCNPAAQAHRELTSAVILQH